MGLTLPEGHVAKNETITISSSQIQDMLKLVFLRFFFFFFWFFQVGSSGCGRQKSLIISAAAAAAATSHQSGPTLCDPIDGSPPGSPVPGILQARTLEWAAISFSNA